MEKDNCFDCLKITLKKIGLYCVAAVPVIGFPAELDLSLQVCKHRVCYHMQKKKKKTIIVLVLCSTSYVIFTVK